MQRILLALCLWLCACPSGAAGITTTNLGILSPADLVSAIVGPGMIVSNITYQGATLSAGTFAGGTGILGFEEGIILSSGNIASVPGPNTGLPPTTQCFTPGDPDLDVLAGQATHDAAILEFDFIPQYSVLTFQYVFASAEYNEFVNQFNDVFGFFVNTVNVALVPSTGQPVSINTINGGNPLGYNPVNPQFFINNEAPVTAVNLALDGLTVVLTATASVNAGVVNHMKLSIADSLDMSLDSVVFIKANSFVVPTPTHTPSPSSTASPTPSTSPTISQTPTNSVTFSFSPTPSHTSTVSPSFTRTPTFSVSPSPTSTPTFSRTPTVTSTFSSSSTPTLTATFSLTPTLTLSGTVTISPTVTATATATPATLILHLFPASPNPFGQGGTTITYFVSVESDMAIRIYDVSGERVRELDPYVARAGNNAQFWDGNNGSGHTVASGIFIYQVEAVSRRDERASDFGKCAAVR